jgi:hypothetical protein
MTSVQIQVVSPGAIVAINPGELTADGGDHRSQIVITELTGPDGSTSMPDGSKVGLTVVDCAAQRTDGACISSLGGTLISAGTSPGDGTPAANNPNFAIFTVAGGLIQAAYSDQGIVAGVGETKTARIAVVRADAEGNILSTTSIGTGRLHANGTTYADASSEWGAIRSTWTAPITFSNIRDAAGNPVPDGGKVLVSAGNCASKNQAWGGCVSSAGGTIADGTPSGSWKLFAVQNGSVTVTYSGAGATLDRYGSYISVQIVPASPDGTPIVDANNEAYSLLGGVYQLWVNP